MPKPLMSDAEIRRRKKVQGNLSIVGGTLGLTALGARGGATAFAGKRAGKLLRVAGDPQREQKLKDISTGLTTAGAGLGGAGAYNFAAYTKAESRKRSLNVKKSWEAPMDFGLGGVQQGENVSKAYTSSERRDINSAGNHGIVPGAAGGYAAYKGARAAKGAKWGYQMSRDLGSSAGRSVKAGAKLIPIAAKAPGKYSIPAALGGAYAGAVGNGYRKQRQIDRSKQVHKASDWMNITEHQRRARDSRRTQRRGASAAALGYTVGAGSAGLAMVHQKNPVHQVRNVAVSTKNVGEAAWKMRGVKGPMASMARKGNLKALKGVAGRNKYGVGVIAGGAAMAGGLATSAGARANEKRHDRAIARLRQNRVTKAYDPERNRQRRLDHYATAASIGAGAAATGALIAGHKATPGLKKLVNVKSHSKTLKTTGAATGLGLTAVGLGVGSDRIRGYKNGRGGRYTPLH